MDDYKEVHFDKYCETCKHSTTKEYESPCNECLETPMSANTEKPTEWKGAAK